MAWAEDLAADVAARGYFRADARVCIKDSGRIMVEASGWTDDGYGPSSDLVINTQYLDCVTDYDPKSFDKQFIDREEKRRQKAQEKLAHLIDEIKHLGIDIDVNPLLEISKQLSSNVIEYQTD
jgi:hypothetical protein